MCEHETDDSFCMLPSLKAYKIKNSYVNKEPELYASERGKPGKKDVIGSAEFKTFVLNIRVINDHLPPWAVAHFEK